jgi:hypothetical protein
METPRRDFLIGSETGTFGAPASFRVAGVPLWRALDQLLDVYGYDWGVRHGVVLCWPATQFRSVRATPPGPPADAELPAGARPVPLALHGAVRVADALEMARKAGLAEVAADPELRGWLVAGRLTDASEWRLATALGGALDAASEGVGPVVVLHVGSLRRLDEARAVPESAKPPNAQAAEGVRERLRTEVLARVTAQQWALMRSQTVAEIPFRELPAPIAALFVATAERAAGGEGRAEGPAVIDWARPDRASVDIYVGQSTRPDAQGAALVSTFVTVRCNVPLAGGALLGF